MICIVFSVTPSKDIALTYLFNTLNLDRKRFPKAKDLVYVGF